MPRRTATVTPSDNQLEKEEINSEHESGSNADSVLALDDLRSLIFLGSLTQTVKIGGFSFEVSTLTTSQQRDVMKDIMSHGDATERMLDIKPLTMAYSVKSINGVPLEDLCDDPAKKTITEKRLDVMMQMQTVVVERLYQVYDDLVTRSGKEIGLEDLKG